MAPGTGPLLGARRDARRRVSARAEHDGRVRRPPEATELRPSPGALRARWRLAFDAAASALRAGGFCLPPDEIREHTQLLAQERTQTARLLEALARNEHTDQSFLHLLLPTREARRLVGLPADVVACVFNLDGVLVGSAAAHAAAWRETFDEFLSRRVERTHGSFAPFRPEVDYRTHLHGRPRLDGVRAFLASRGMRLPEGDPTDPPDAETVHGLANRKNAALLRRIERQGLTAFEGAREYLETARDAGLRCAVVSASANTDTILAQTGLAHLIDAYVDGNAIVAENLRPRPEPDILLAACALLGTEPRETAVFETSQAGVVAACAAGFGLVVGIDSSETAKALRGAGADVVSPGIEDFLTRTLAA